MELRDFVRIFTKQRPLLMSIVVASALLGWCVWWLQPLCVAADLTLNIARTGVQQTNDYRYDGFYRLQADERFADTVVRWLGSPRMVEDIALAAKARPISGAPWQFGPAFQAERLSSQVIRVIYRARTNDEAKRLAQGILARVNQETAALNGSAQDESWFVVRGEEPVVTDGRFVWPKALGIAFVLGLFVAFWTGLVRHYWKRK